MIKLVGGVDVRYSILMPEGEDCQVGGVTVAVNRRQHFSGQRVSLRQEPVVACTSWGAPVGAEFNPSASCSPRVDGGVEPREAGRLPW